MSPAAKAMAVNTNGEAIQAATNSAGRNFRSARAISVERRALRSWPSMTRVRPAMTADSRSAPAAGSLEARGDAAGAGHRNADRDEEHRTGRQAGDEEWQHSHGCLLLPV